MTKYKVFTVDCKWIQTKDDTAHCTFDYWNWEETKNKALELFDEWKDKKVKCRLEILNIYFTDWVGKYQDDGARTRLTVIYSYPSTLRDD